MRTDAAQCAPIYRARACVRVREGVCVRERERVGDLFLHATF